MKKKKPIFEVEQFDDHDKSITVYSKNLNISVHYDDVDHRKVKRDLNKMIDILNKHWNDDKTAS